ncbi:hypothetical protein [Prevotella sp.]|uniref:hypothetical protein n=1 Tax=Prevotella sp. TaxID=59823 RepID=UPI0027E21B4C|nr:hypothetical protein [Prevotella sp.]
MDFQKQLDTVTGALNIFDMSYLVSGATMLGVLVYAFPNLKDFVFHKDQIMVSILICVVFTYVLGMVSWIAGKQFRYWMMEHFGEKKTNDEDFESKFNETAQCFNFQGETIKKLMEDDKNIAYSYMWMRLDNSQDEDCRSRFVFASRSWVLRAIYEGLIPPVFILAATILVKYFSVWIGWCETFFQRLGDWSGMVIPSWGKNTIVGLIGVVIMTSIAYIIVKLLAREARRCANTQIREVIVAYYHFVENKENMPSNTETDSNREQETNKNMFLVLLDKFRGSVKKLFE